jgi:NADH-quinone oxidoreductase subunit M
VFDATAASVDQLVNSYTAAVQAAHDVASAAH